jgi:hypothetical protein
VASERRVNVVTLADRDSAIRHSVLVVVVHAIHAWRHADDQVPFVMEQPAGDVPGRIVVEALDEQLRMISEPVAVAIFDAVDALLERREVAPVARSILVVILNPRVFLAAFRT